MSYILLWASETEMKLFIKPSEGDKDQQINANSTTQSNNFNSFWYKFSKLLHPRTKKQVYSHFSKKFSH